MAKIRDSKLKESSGGYQRVLGVDALGSLISRIHATVISSGTELERMIIDKVEKIPDLDKFLDCDSMPEGVYIAPKKQVKECRKLQINSSEPDFLIFKRRDGKQACYVIELKDGHVFDTKKAGAERHAVHSFVRDNGQHLQYRVHSRFCAFNQEDKQAIVRGFKGKIKQEEAMTGREFCELLELDYEEIVESRKLDQSDNLEFFLSELVKIDKIRITLKKLLGSGEG